MQWRRSAVVAGTDGGRKAGRAPAFEALEPRTLLSAATAAAAAGSDGLFAVDISTAGTYEVDVYQASQYGTSGAVTNVTLGATNPPVAVHLASVPAATVTGNTLVASWDVDLGVGRALVRVPSSYYTPAGSAAPVVVLPPSNLALTVQSAYAVSLTWTNNGGAGTLFKVEREIAGSNLWTVVGTTAAGVTSFTDTTVAPSTSYAYSVYALGASGNSSAAAAQAATTLAPSPQSAYGGESGPSPVQTVTTAAAILPGTGWTGATPQPAALGQVGQDMYNENAIARWDVVPYQTFSGTFNVGVVAFDSTGIKEVDFSVNGGAWVAVTQMTLNPQTANTSGVGNASAGVVEYWATLNAADFADGQIEIRAIAVPNVGVPRVLQGATIQANGNNSLFLNANGQNSLPQSVRYVSPTGSDTTGDGSQTNPFATIFKAAMSINSANNGHADNGLIYLEAGNYDWAGSPGWPYPTTSSAWFTISSAPGLSPSQVCITTSSTTTQLDATRVHIEGLTISCSLSQKGGMGASIWIDDCILQRNSTTGGDNGFVSPSLWDGGIYYTNCDISNCQNAVQAAIICRDVAVHDIGEDAFRDVQVLVNCTSANQGGTGHPDVVQYTAENDAIVYGLTATVGITAQGISWNGNPTDVAIVDATIVVKPNTYFVLQMEFAQRNTFIWDGSFTGGLGNRWNTGNVNLDNGVPMAFSAIDVVVDNCGNAFRGMVVPGVTYLNGG